MITRKLIHYLCEDWIERSVTPGQHSSWLVMPIVSLGRTLPSHPHTYDGFLYLKAIIPLALSIYSISLKHQEGET